MYSKTSPQWNDGPAKSQICLISRSTLLMPPDLYTHLLENLHSRDDVRKCAESHPHVGYDALLSIYSQKYRKTIRLRIRELRSYICASHYFQRYQRNERIVDIAESRDVNCAPALLARIILESSFPTASKSEITAMMNDPTILKSKYSDERLSKEVAEANQADDFYSQEAVSIRRRMGLHYEFVLCQHLRALRIPFLTESSLRDRGFHKTPDVLLEIPIYVAGTIVHWIDSKAMFGDHEAQMSHKDQVQGYINRFGSGMIIYWFGYLEQSETLSSKATLSICDACLSDAINNDVEAHMSSDLLIRDCFPNKAEIVLPLLKT